MKNDHIISLIEERPPGNLSASELERINAHASQCAECRLAFQAAIVSSRMLRERASTSVEPSPFFHTRALAAIMESARVSGREGSSGPESFGFLKMWQAARILIASMAAIVVTLTLLTMLNGKPQTRIGDQVSSSNVDMVFEDDNLAQDDMTNSQVFMNLYNQEAEGADGNQQ